MIKKFIGILVVMLIVTGGVASAGTYMKVFDTSSYNINKHIDGDAYCYVLTSKNGSAGQISCVPKRSQ